MGRSSFMAFLLLSALLFLSLQPGLGRKLLENGGDALPSAMRVQETPRKTRERLGVEVMDYEDVGPNVNSKSGYPFTVPSLEEPAPSPTSASG